MEAERDVVRTNAVCDRADGPPPSGAWGWWCCRCP